MTRRPSDDAPIRAAWWLAGATLCVLLLVACSTASRRAARDLLLDDWAEDSVHVPITTARRFVHEPVAKKTCSKCHIDEKSEKLLKPVPALCFECHKDFRKNWKTDDLHAPVLDGECGACHEPHRSAFTNRLQKAAGSLCFDCHDRPEPALKVVHAPFAEGDCSACHGGHASTNRPLLRLPASRLCLECHKPFQGAFVHSPVEEGDCQACHVAHASTAAGLLKKKGDALCLDCHDKKDMDEVRAHMSEPDKRCTSCHQSHASKHKVLLKRAPEGAT